MSEIVASGWNGNIRLLGDRVAIEKFRPRFYAFDFGGIGETVFQLDGQATQRFRESKTKSIRMHGIGKAGFYSLAVANAPLVGGSGVDQKWASYPSVVIFESDSNEEFLQLRDAIDAAIERLKLPPTSLNDHLEVLSQLHKSGVISDEEFAQAKTRFIGPTQDSAQKAAHLIRQLHDLHQAGALTDSEFRQKKWDVLSKQ